MLYEVITPYENEQDDIYDIIDWISKQEWCNGKVGMYGGSYTGFSQWSTVKNSHPALKTIVPQVAVMPGFDAPMENNVQMNLGLYWPNDNIYKKAPIRSVITSYSIHYTKLYDAPLVSPKIRKYLYIWLG